MFQTRCGEAIPVSDVIFAYPDLLYRGYDVASLFDRFYPTECPWAEQRVFLAYDTKEDAFYVGFDGCSEDEEPRAALALVTVDDAGEIEELQFTLFRGLFYDSGSLYDTHMRLNDDVLFLHCD